jgi:nuclear pore complex protein Nup98-Nup96
LILFNFYLHDFLSDIVHNFEHDRACYSKMSEELCELLMNTPGKPNLYMESFQKMLSAPVPADHKLSYAQEAVSVFTELLCTSS